MRKRHALTGDDIVVRSDRLLTTKIDGELIAMSVEQGICYGLNSVGTRIWELIAEPVSIDNLCAQLVGEYDVEEGPCRIEVTNLLESLLLQKLLTAGTS